MVNFLKKYFNKLLNIGTLPSDSEPLRIKKSSLLMLPIIIGIAAFVWGLLYIFLGHYISAAIPLSYTFISIINLWHLNKTKDIVPFFKVQMILVLLLPFLLMWSLGGFAHGSYVFIWAFYAPIAALIYQKTSKAKYWFYSFLALVIFSTIIDPLLIQNNTSFLPNIAIELFYLLNISAGFHGIYFLFNYFIEENEKSANSLLQKEHDMLLKRTDELNKANLKLQYLANYDDLTNLPNRYYLLENMKQMMSHAKRNKNQLALLFLDLDGFKDVNDNHGHLMGDKILRLVAHRIKSLLREEDTVARLGGDEFAILISNFTDTNYIEDIAKRVINKINLDYPNLPSIKIGASIGISIFPMHSEDLDTLIKYSDDAMYKVKKSSKNSFLFHTN